MPVLAQGSTLCCRVFCCHPFFQALGTAYLFLVSGFLYYNFSLFIKLAEQKDRRRKNKRWSKSTDGGKSSGGGERSDRVKTPAGLNQPREKINWRDRVIWCGKCRLD
jgi:hypothetical protein